MHPQDDIQILSAAWKRAADALKIRLEAPYVMKDASGNETVCAAYLPDFGGSKGMVIGSLDRPRAQLKRGAEERGFYYSFINFKIYEKYDEEVFREALLDWGFFGDESMRPIWMK